MMTRPRSLHPTPAPLALAAAALFVPVAAAQTATDAAAQAAIELSTVEVVGRSQSGAYHAAEATGAKTDLPLRELPQSVRVITRQAIDDLGATRLDEVLDYVGGVSRQHNFGGLWDNVVIRGLPGNENVNMATLLNGFAGNRGFNAPRDLAGVERIEFLKGPAAALYGSSEPGGTLNIVSKRPGWKAAHSAEAYAGSHGFRRAALDSTGPLGEDFAYRLNVAAEEREGWRDHAGSERQVLAPAFSWRLGADTLLDYRGEFLRHAAPLDRGVVAVDNRLGAVPRSRFLGEPADGDMTVDNRAHQLVLSQEWSSAWRSRLGLSLRETALEGFSTESGSLQADQRTLWRQRRFRDYDSRDAALQAELQGTLDTGGLGHDLLLGVETYRFRMDSLMLRANPSAGAPYAIDIHEPVYGQPQPVPGPNTDTRERQRGTALYLQDVLHLAPRWRLLAGVRVDRHEQQVEGVANRRPVRQRQEPTATSPRIGLSWLPTAQWTVYANAGQSFRPNSGLDRSGNAFEPERGQAFEAGSKWESADRRFGATTTLFDIRKRNVLTADPANASAENFMVAAGAVRSRGLELDLSGQLGTHWRVNASLVLNDVEVTRDNTLQVGGRLSNVPRVNGSALAVYEDALANGQRWGLGGGFTHVGTRLGQQARTQDEARLGTPAFELPGYTTAKLVAYWRLSPVLRLSLDVDNLFDRTHYTSSYSRLWVAPGTPRSLTAGLQAKF
ncbi:TonB-dependent siderophore receptor [Caldimonas tepidiphila]|uniref:TonB-dependent siderophore receptor n=1 Tax=Caldimonas tepidiphila TaxID=2315841 RepID=UPI000E5B3CC4|nr:TonB-dependent receptor [Caldimonas tepidiphila]